MFIGDKHRVTGFNVVHLMRRHVVRFMSPILPITYPVYICYGLFRTLRLSFQSVLLIIRTYLDLFVSVNFYFNKPPLKFHNDFYTNCILRSFLISEVKTLLPSL